MTSAPQLRVALADDEPLAREGLRLLLAEHGDLEVVGEAGNGREAVALVKSTRPDLLLLDVQMPELNGFEVVDALSPSELPPALIFVTAYDRYAVKAFDVHALDYLLKPFEDERFHEAVSRARAQLRLSRVFGLAERLAALSDRGELPADELRAGQRYPDRLAIKDLGRVIFLEVADIDWIEAADYYVELHVGGTTYLHRETMQRLEARLDPARFIRVHRSAIVNQRRIKELRSGGRRDAAVILLDGSEIRVARSHRDKLTRLLQP